MKKLKQSIIDIWESIKCLAFIAIFILYVIFNSVTGRWDNE
jgi:hypothetical protein